MSAGTHTGSTGTAGDLTKGRAGIRGLLWLTWRQHRWPIVITAGATAALTVLMLVTTADLASLSKTCPLDSCATTSRADSYATYLMNTVVFVPVLIAVFWGIPLLAREHEQRMLPLAWSQDISPLRWLWGKTAILGLIAAAMGTVLAGASQHLAHNYHAFTGRSLFEGTAFQAGGWLPLTLTLAWLTLGIAAGAATRRTMPAIGAVAALWFGRTALMTKLRPNFMKPLEILKPLAPQQGSRQAAASAASPRPNDMGIGNSNPPFVDSRGTHHTAQQVMTQWCNDSGINTSGHAKSSSTDPLLTCLRQHEIVGSPISYQPASRMGTFHLIENSANLALLAASLLVAWWCVHTTRTTTQ